MEPHVSTEDEGEPKERKIHFAVPASVPTNLDPRQVEMIRRRRPTPATLFRVADQSSPEDDQSTHQVKWVVGENGVLKPKRVIPNVYQPPSLRAVQKMAEAHMQSLGIYPSLEDPCEREEEEDHWQGTEGEDTSPTKAADHQETPTTEQSGKFSSVRETARQIQAAQEEEEEDEEEEEEEEEDVEEEEGDKIKGTTEKKSRGNY
ncbi:protein phosphatase 1 regulatory subunit 1B isoform X1 [Sander vitreus]